MKRIIVLLVVIAGTLTLPAQDLSPYRLAGITSGDLSTIRSEVRSELQKLGFEVLGAYQPAGDPDRWVIALTAPELKKSAQKIGGLACLGAILRVGITREKNGTVISYTDPLYWGNAYLQDGFDQEQDAFRRIAGQLETAFSRWSAGEKAAFGSRKGLSEKKLRSYHYMFGMPYLKDYVVLKEFKDHNSAVEQVQKGLSQKSSKLEKVYMVHYPAAGVSIFGIGLHGDQGEGHFMPKIDIGEHRHTAFLPYELIVLKEKVIMLHGRYRIALSFPDLTMGTFMKIVSTPGDIEDYFKTLVE